MTSHLSQWEGLNPHGYAIACESSKLNTWQMAVKEVNSNTGCIKKFHKNC